MKETLSDRCRLVIENRDVFGKTFRLESSYFYPVCAAMFTDRGRKADGETLKLCHNLLKSKVGAFSSFRGAATPAVVAMLALDESPEERLERSIELYGALKEQFFGSDYLPVVAMILSGMIGRERHGEVSERAGRIYQLMKEKHRWITSSEDTVFAAMLALSDRGDEELIEECEACFAELRERFSAGNAVQSLSHVLTLCDDGVRTATEKCRDVIRVYDSLKEKKNKYGMGYELATLGVIAMLPCGIDEAIRDLLDASAFLKTQKGYGVFGFTKAQRLMHASMIVSGEHLGASDTMAGAAVGSTLSMVAAQQAATCAAISASTAATVAARSASH